MTQYGDNTAIDGDDRRTHLEFIQAIVTRMSSASSMAKSWLLPVVTASYGYALTKDDGSVAMLGVLTTLLFGFLDANYLRQERAYRMLYNAIVGGTGNVPLFSLNSADAQGPTPPATTPWQKFGSLVGRWVPDRGVWLSWSIAPFYGALILIGCLIALLS
jgi:hypothetical protein